MMQKNNHWLLHPGKETVGILLPLFLPVLLVAVFHDYFSTQTEVTTLWWLVLVLIIDVGHVYSTLFRFYWEKNTFQKYRTHVIIIPLVAFAAGVAVHWVSAMAFWRVLAYTALFHFIRQQYGFMRLYSRHQQQPRLGRWIDAAIIYSSTVYPVLFWHLYLTESLSWFVPHDFIALPSAPLALWAERGYWLILICYVAKELFVSIRHRDLNLPKNGIILGTSLSWYAGIILFRGDLAFTLLNVVAHGIPYMTLIWLYGEKKSSRRFSFTWKGVIIFGLALCVLAYLEEALWDVLVWKDHEALFPFFTDLNPIGHPHVLSFIVPLLVVPQLTHYILDGFIWRFSTDTNARWANRS